MGSFVRSLKCMECGYEYDPRRVIYSCEKCGGLLDVKYDYNAIMDRISIGDIKKRDPFILSKWIEFLPIEDKSKIELATLGESTTPLIKSQKLAKKIGVNEFYLKNDSLFPTGSFKDRSMPIAVIKALEFGVKIVSIVSSGNAAASLTAHGARAGLETIVFVDEETPLSKLAQIMIYGAKIIMVKASYSVAEKLFVKAREKFGWYDCNSEFNPFRFEGNKTCAYEICEQVNWKLQNWIISPIGSGSGLASTWKGFKEMNKISWIDQLPQLAGIQAEACAPVVNAYKEREKKIKSVVPRFTSATAIKISDPAQGNSALTAIYESKGVAEAVTETEILEAVKLLAKEGIFLEPAGAASVAGAIKLVKEKKIDRDEKVICVLTGHGLKTPEIAIKMLKKPIEIAPKIEEIEKKLMTILNG